MGARDAWALLAALALAGCAGKPAMPDASRAELLETYWRLLEIDGKPVATPAGAREPHIILRRDGARVGGFAGCNTLAGTYKLDGGSLRFGPLAMTRMACVSAEANAREAAFTRALEDTVSQRIAADKLELRDPATTVRARFEARPPK